MQHARVLQALVVVVVVVAIVYWWRSRGRPKESFGDPAMRVQTQKIVDAITGVPYERIRDRIPPQIIEDAMSKVPFVRPTPEEQAEIEARSLSMANFVDKRGVYEPYTAAGVGDELAQCHAERPVDYGEVALAAVADSNMLTRQRTWYNGLAPFSGAAGVRNLDPINVTDALPRQGLTGFNPSPVVQTNALQITEVDAYDLAANERSSFSF